MMINLELPWAQQSFVAIDTETTGFRRDDRICQVAVSRFDGETGEIVSKSWIVNPGIPIPREVSVIHGITDDMVRDAPSFAGIQEEFLDLVQGQIWVIHQAAFDIRMLVRELGAGALPNVPVVCTLTGARKHPQTTIRRGHKLPDLANAFDVPYKAASLHDAQYDTELLLHVARAMYDGYPTRSAITGMSHEWA